MGGCTQNSSRGPQVAAVCQCVYNKIVQTIPFKDFEAAEEQIKAGNSPPPSWLFEYAKACQQA